MGTAFPQTCSEVATEPTQIAIEGIDEPTILQYFERLNAGNFEATSQLFALEGMLQPPFEAMVIGQTEIAAYLQKEAKGFILLPQQGQQVLESENLENDDTEFLVLGKVQTSLFTVNVSWTFVLNPNKQIVLAKVNLLASLQELMHLRQ
ncbi:nuclear transport factor 2 family protein [Phormidium sp. CLA17]|uniref:ketosteroid isomerase family protein n=1 Tax=Leptolyngbya sp. Cla-17 TaxID=2803751 RepID=UPI001492D285|nr:ketosteroid isomerase family protein [Leptolyngbya sp. Cla-17]MBM0741272.1 nuclear transport factor 2 family protein [Leptolyngbya sp. Cla-17]